MCQCSGLGGNSRVVGPVQAYLGPPPPPPTHPTHPTPKNTLFTDISAAVPNAPGQRDAKATISSNQTSLELLRVGMLAITLQLVLVETGGPVFPGPKRVEAQVEALNYQSLRQNNEAQDDPERVTLAWDNVQLTSWRHMMMPAGGTIPYNCMPRAGNWGEGVTKGEQKVEKLRAAQERGGSCKSQGAEQGQSTARSAPGGHLLAQ